ncbi:hypothetical protein CHH80_08730 [Bacillus sp. 7504-2]|nr:hypothetical protein CHH80_08730 [Bacillus sp. 7504-2]
MSAALFLLRTDKHFEGRESAIVTSTTMLLLLKMAHDRHWFAVYHKPKAHGTKKFNAIVI